MQKRKSTELRFRLLGFILILAVLAGACAPVPAQPALTQPPAAEPAVQPTPVPTAAEEPAPAASSAEILLTDGLGREIRLPAPVQKVVSLAPSSTEILYAVGAGAALVGRDTFSDYPAEALEVQDIGGGFGELNLEAILALEPDLVLASSLTPDEQIQALEKTGLIVFALANPADFPGLYENLRTTAALVGHSPEAETLIAGLEQRVAAVAGVIATVTERPLVFYELDGTDPTAPWTPGPGTFIDTLIGLAGGENLGAGLSGDWVQVSLEELIARDPDLILLGDATWGGVTVESASARSGWDALRAVQQGRIYPFNDNLVARPGPRLVDGLEAMAELLHPELFQ